MEHTKKIGVRVTRGWNDVAINALKTLVIGFIALLAWDWLESGDWDPQGVASNAAVVAVSLFVLDTILLGSRKGAGGVH